MMICRVRKIKSYDDIRYSERHSDRYCLLRLSPRWYDTNRVSILLSAARALDQMIWNNTCSFVAVDVSTDRF